MATLAVQAYRDVDGFDALAGEWNGLLRRSTADTVFLTLEYQRLWWETLGDGALYILASRDGESLVGIAPLFAVPGRRMLTTVGCVEVSDYLDWIAARGREAEVCAAVVEHLAGPDAPAWDEIALCNVPQDSPTLRLLPPLAEARGWAVSIVKEEVCPIVRLPRTWDDYLGMLDKKERHELRRKLRRAEAGTTWYIVGASHDLEAEVEDFLRLMAASTPEKAAFLTPRMRLFFHRLARAAYEAGWLQLAFLEVEGRKAAAYLNFVYGNRVLVYNSGLDWRTFPQLSAGLVLAAHCIRYAIEQGYEAFDFLRGNERYKYQLGGQDVEVRRLAIRKTPSASF